MSQDDSESRSTSVPWFPFYPKDFASDSKVEAMTPAQVGNLILLLCKAWHEDPPGTLPNDDDILRRWSRAGGSWKMNRVPVMSVFSLESDNRYHQKRMVKEAANQALKHNARVQAGQKGGFAKSSNARSLLPVCYKQNSSNQSQSQNQIQKEEEEKKGKTLKRVPPAAQSFESLIAELKPIYPWVNMEVEVSKMKAWITTPRGKGKTLTRQRVVNWLNNVEPPLNAPQANEQTNGNGTFNKPTLKEVWAFAKSQKLNLTSAKVTFNQWVADGWRHKGRPIESDEQWQAILLTPDRKPFG